MSRTIDELALHPGCAVPFKAATLDKPISIRMFTLQVQAVAEAQQERSWVGTSSGETEGAIEKVKIDIAYRARVVTDKKVIDGALLQFEKTVKALSFDKQCELLRLLLRQVGFNSIDLGKDPLPSDPHIWNNPILTQWHAVTPDMLPTDILSRTCETPAGHTRQLRGPPPHI